MSSKILNSKITNVELVGENIFKAIGSFETDYSSELGNFEIPKNTN